MQDENERYQRKQRIVETTMKYWDEPPCMDLREYLADLVMRVEDLEADRATIARVRAICAGDHDAAYDLRADILAEIGGES